jgi:hypothetical protein
MDSGEFPLHNPTQRLDFFLPAGEMSKLMPSPEDSLCTGAAADGRANSQEKKHGGDPWLSELGLGFWSV